MANPQDFIVQPVNALGAYLGGVQAKQQQVQGQEQNALLKLQQQYTMEQRNALQQKGQMDAQEAQRKQQLEILTRLGQATKNIAGIPDKQAQAQLWGQVVEQHRPIYGDMVDQFKDPSTIPAVAAMVEKELAKYGAPVAGVNLKTGQPEFRVFSNTGDSRLVDDFAPPAAAPKEQPKPDIKPIYSLDGKLLGDGTIDPRSGTAYVGSKALPTGQYTTAKPDAAITKDAGKAQAKAQAQARSAKNTLEVIADAKKIAQNEWGTTGVTGQLLSNVGSTDARNLRAKLVTIKANLGFDRLQEMRDNSPTGGALGQVAVQELEALQSTVASLDQAQSSEEVLNALTRIENHYNAWLQAVQQANNIPAAPKPKLVPDAVKTGDFSGWSGSAVGE